MPLPSYVIKKDITGSNEKENVVVISSSAERIQYLLWDQLDALAQAKFDSDVAGSPDLITAMRNIRHRNQTFLSYLSYAIIRVRIGDTGTAFEDESPANIIQDVYDVDKKKLRVGAYSGNSELGTYQATNVFSYLGTSGPSRIRDIITTSNSASVGSFEGKIRLETGTTSNSQAHVETVERGRYIPGKSAVAGAGVFVVSDLTGDQSVTVQLGDSLNAAQVVITESTATIKVIRDGIVQSSVDQLDWNLNSADGSISDVTDQVLNFDPNNRGYIYRFFFNWYGVGKIIFSVQDTTKNSEEPINNYPVHEYIPSEFLGNSFIDPSLPVTVIADNGTTTGNVIVDIGGRSYDILGQFSPEFRRTSVLQSFDGYAAGRTVAFGLRRKAEFPTAGRNNSVPVYFSKKESLLTGGDVLIRTYSVPRGTMTGAWSKPPEVNDPAETALELNTTVTDITGLPDADKFLLFGPEIIITGTDGPVRPGGGLDPSLVEDKGLRIPVIGDEEFVIEVEATAPISGPLILTMIEEF